MHMENLLLVSYMNSYSQKFAYCSKQSQLRALDMYAGIMNSNK